MKKLLYTLLALVLILVNIFSYSILNNKRFFDFLYNDNQVVHINYNASIASMNNSKFINGLMKFSKQNDVNISQYTFLSDTDLNIYSTNIENDPKVQLVSGSFPVGSKYISNENLNPLNAEQSGVFAFPLSRFQIHIYDIKEFENVGLSNDFYISGANKNILDDFIKEFSNYGKISKVEKGINSLVIMNVPLLMVVILSFIIFLIVLFYFLIQDRKNILLQELWGYSKYLVLSSLFKKFAKFLCIFLISLILGGLLFVLLYNQLHFLVYYILLFVITNTLTIVILLSLIFLGVIFVQRFNTSAGNIRGKLPFQRIQWISFIIKTVISLVLFGLLIMSLDNFYYLKRKVDSLHYWEHTQNIFKVEVGPLSEDIDNNLKLDRDLNNRLFNFYKKLESNNDGFLMKSNNFNVVNYVDNKPIYSYKYNVNDKKEIYSPQGRSVTINRNYLNVNPIKTINGENVTSQIDDSKNTLNVLVPIKFKKMEKTIVESYKEWFYFQKVDVNNMYNKDLGYNLNKTSITDLNINIIYTANKQNYFTFDSNTGDKKNNIQDPLAIIYNDTIDTSAIGAYATTSLFFLDNSKGQAFANISPLLNETKVSEIHSVSSIYDENKNDIVQQKWLLFQKIVSLIISIISSTIFFIIFIWSYYKSNIYQINIKYLFGYSYLKRNKTVILLVSISNTLSGLIVYAVFNRHIIFVMLTTVLIIDIIIISLLSNYLVKKNINKVLKGDHT
ncbi:DUF1430 domain-containing protein [Priestia aryabhattai]|uniref:DUF1430 domain-containing protein n=1 Tax=Priestia TaxID=2800373 RepID=UPI002E218426|nr:DUF1430 domain-containing protein [Priestia aryabhattai]